MKIIFKAKVPVNDYTDWLFQTTALMVKDLNRQQELVQKLSERDQLGSTQIASAFVMPHVVEETLNESVIILSQLSTPINYIDGNSVDTGLFIFAVPNDDDVTNFIDKVLQKGLLEPFRDRSLTIDKFNQLLR